MGDQKSDSRPTSRLLGDRVRSTNVVLKPLPKKPQGELSCSTISFLVFAMLQYTLSRTHEVQALEEMLHSMGIRVGHRLLNLVSFREKNYRRDTRILPVLQFVSQNCWKHLFGHPGELFKSQETDNEYMINDKKFLLTKYTSTPKGDGFINCGAIGAGIIEGVLCGCEFPARVTAHIQDLDAHRADPGAITFVIRFVPEVLAREARLDGKN